MYEIVLSREYATDEATMYARVIRTPSMINDTSIDTLILEVDHPCNDFSYIITADLSSNDINSVDIYKTWEEIWKIIVTEMDYPITDMYLVSIETMLEGNGIHPKYQIGCRVFKKGGSIND